MEYSQENIDESKILSYLKGEQLSDEERDEIAQWLQDAENQAEAQKIYQAWELSLLTLEKTYDSDAAFDKLNKRITTDQAVSETPVIPIQRRWWYAAAASVVLLITALWYFQQSPEFKEIHSGLASLSTTLEDESIVTLNENSSIKYIPATFTKADTERKVSLTGEAYFEVAHNPVKPFVVTTHDIQVEVLGTKFLVKTSQQSPTEVLVTEGKVKVTIFETGESYILTAKEQLTKEKGNQPKVAPSDVNKLYWKTGVIEFPGTPLKEVIRVLEKEFDVEISLENEQLVDCNITVTLKKQSIETIMMVIDSTLGLEHEKNGNKILIKGDACQ